MDRAQVPTVNFLIQNLHLTQSEPASEPRKIGSNLKWGCAKRLCEDLFEATYLACLSDWCCSTPL